MFDREDFGRLVKALRGLWSQFLLSLNDTPGVMSAFEEFTIEPVEVTWTMAARPGRAVLKVGEMLISKPGRA